MEGSHDTPGCQIDPSLLTSVSQDYRLFLASHVSLDVPCIFRNLPLASRSEPWVLFSGWPQSLIPNPGLSLSVVVLVLLALIALGELNMASSLPHNHDHALWVSITAS